MSGLTNPKVSGARGLGRFEFSKAPSSRSSRLIQKVNRKPHFTTATTMDEEHIEKPSKRKRNAAKAKPKEQRQHSATKEAVADIEDLFSDKEIHKIRASLLDWYDHNQRDLPWRRITQTKEIPVKEEEGEGEGEGERRAYGVWVSEVMLQQTRVQTVIDYYNRWMLKWPTLHHLAQASLEEVNEMWAGLGYYRRARFLLEGRSLRVYPWRSCRNIVVVPFHSELRWEVIYYGHVCDLFTGDHYLLNFSGVIDGIAPMVQEGARMIVAGGDGFPKTVSSLLKVPGIGDYTAGAIASIAFKEVVPVVDGNVIRVLARLKAISANPKDKVTVKKFWQLHVLCSWFLSLTIQYIVVRKLAAQLVDPHRPGDFNQSLMELGATLCTPLNPSCSSCPVSGECRVLAISKLDKLVLITDYPAKSIKLKQRHEFSAVCVVEISGRHDLIEGDQSNSVFLLVKRPDEGLLAGLWEFPSVMLGKEAALTRRRKEMNCFLKKSFKLDPQRTCSILLREDVGEFIHIFSHIRLKVYVELLIVHLKGDMSDLFSMRDGENTTWKCVDRQALSSLGLTSGVRKVYTMVQKFKQNRLSTASAAARKRTNSKKSGLS
ncbi:hypothetical protein DKX38_021629 [Salix brachista]|uniref:Adenine DNA glycosylase n=1 Tax=Salix brachista TaxID=2182728 RepID=A0A5N5K8U0_9ROSI|nr:hypothetical protein DKX38_021629 [Salix brachista]